MSTTGRTWTDTPACCPALPCRWRQSGAASVLFLRMLKFAYACWALHWQRKALPKLCSEFCTHPLLDGGWCLAGREAARRGGGRGDLTAPVQRLPDFLSGQVVPLSLFPKCCRRCRLPGALRCITCIGFRQTTTDMVQRRCVEP